MLQCLPGATAVEWERQARADPLTRPVFFVTFLIGRPSGPWISGSSQAEKSKAGLVGTEAFL